MSAQIGHPEHSKEQPSKRQLEEAAYKILHYLRVKAETDNAPIRPTDVFAEALKSC